MDINEIARLAGVSRATVSRFLNDGYVSKEKRRLIAKVIRETGYVPSQSAQQLRTGKTHLVGVIIPKNAGMCRYMNNNVAGVHVPDDMLAELAADKEKAKAGITGVEIAARVIKACRPYCQGVHIMALGWEKHIPKLLEMAGL